MTQRVPPAKAPRWMKAVLTLSLALNLLVVGVLIGQFVTGPQHKGGDMRQMARAIGPMGRALSLEDRKALRQELRRAKPQMQKLREARVQAKEDVLKALRADPFDPKALQMALQQQAQHRVAAGQLGQDILLTYLSQMPQEERLSYAERLASGPR